MDRWLLFCLGLLMVIVNTVVYAESGRYQIEILVFAQGLQTSEAFSQTGSRIQWPTAMAELSAYRQIEDSMLKDGASALLKDPAFQEVAHFNWMQSTGFGSVLLPVHIQSSDGNFDGFIQLRNAQPYELILDVELKSPNVDRSGKRYLYRLNEKRDVKLDETHYFDHPKLGVIVRVTGV